MLGGQSALSVSLSEPCLISSEEDLSQRNQTTRVIINHYEQDILDTAGNPTGEKVSYDRKIIIKADGLCYDAQDYTANPKASPLWEPAVPEFTPADPGKSGIAFTALRGVIQVSISTDIAQSYPLECGFKHRNKAYTLKMGIAGLGYYDSESGKVVVVKEPESVPAEQTESNRLLYRGIFGDIADVEYVYERGRFKQNLIINSLAGLPGPAYFGLNPESTYLVIISRLKSASDSALIESRSLNVGFSELSAEAKVEGGYVAIRFKDAKTGKVLTEFAASGDAADALYDETKLSKEMTTYHTGIYKVLSRKADGSYELAEGVKVSWLSAERRQFPVVLDWELRSGTAQGSECWHAGETYYIQDNYTIPSAHTLTIEGGTVVKLYPSKQIIVSEGARLFARGTDYNYVIITNAADTVGEEISDPPSGNGEGILFESTSSAEYNKCEFDHCKFHNLNTAIRFEPIMEITRNNNPDSLSPIRHCIFRNCNWCIYFAMTTPTVNSIEILNCLMTNGYEAIRAHLMYSHDPQTFNLKVRNCTINNFGGGIIVFSDTGTINVTAKDNLFSYLEVGLDGFGDTSGSDIDYNAFYMCEEQVSGFESGENNIELTSNPYKLSPNSSFYGAEWVNLEEYSYNSQLVDKGEPFSGYPETLSSAIKERTIFCPFNLTNSTINNSTSGECASYNFRSSNLVEYYTDGVEGRTGDTKVDIGFHYDVVHGCVSGENPPTLLSPLKLDPGAVITYASGANLIVDKQGTDTGQLTAKGLPEEMLLFTSTKATGDGITLPSPGDYESAIRLTEDAESPEIDFAVFEYATRGVRILGTSQSVPPSPHTMKNTIFRNCKWGIDSVNVHINVLNCLLYGTEYSAIFFANNENPNHLVANIEGCTFDANKYAFWLDKKTGVEPSAKLLIEDNIFSSHSDTALKCTNEATAEAVVRNNLFWNNAEDVTPGFVEIPQSEGNIQGENPQFCHRSRAADGVTVLEPDPVSGRFNPHDGYYLVQRSGDASRRPLLVGDLDDNNGIGPLYKLTYNHKDDYNETLITENYQIEIRVSEGIPTSWNTFTLLGSYDRSGGYSDGEETDPMPCVVVVKAVASISASADTFAYSFNITLANDSKIKVCLPGVSLNAGDKMVFWVAEDGSTYYTDLNHSSKFDSSKTVPDIFDMDSYFALRWDISSTNGHQPAQSSSLYHPSASYPLRPNPCVDSGTIDRLNGGTTKTEIDDSTGENKNIPDQPASGYNGWDSVADLQKWATSKPIDIGYHYGGQTFWLYDDVHEVWFQGAMAIRFPKQGVSSYVYETELSIQPPVPTVTPTGTPTPTPRPITVQYWVDGAGAEKTLFSGKKNNGSECIGAVFVSRPIHDNSEVTPPQITPIPTQTWSYEQKEALGNEEDIRLRIGYALFRNSAVGTLQDNNVTSDYKNGNDDEYKGIIITPDDPGYFVTSFPGSSGDRRVPNIRWEVASISSVVLPFYH
ncbi:hypothetical protein J7M23_11520, partial [Candidatus Sumerlaeota bacterium]|nr:hypothetical protein [Candidatus Sumerlaeota bacterium]